MKDIKLKNNPVEFGNTSRDILLKLDLDNEIARAKEAEEGLKELINEKVKEIYEYPTKEDFPTPTVAKNSTLYIARDTNKVYILRDLAYVNIAVPENFVMYWIEQLDNALDAEIDRAKAREELLFSCLASEESNRNKGDILKEYRNKIGGQTYNLPYYFDANYTTDNATVTAYSISLDGAGSLRQDSIVVPSANYTTAGLESADDKIHLDDLYSQEADKGAIRLLGKELGSQEPYNFTYYYTVTPAADKINVGIETITLDNNKTLKHYDLDISSANYTYAGLESAQDKQNLDAVRNLLKGDNQHTGTEQIRIPYYFDMTAGSDKIDVTARGVSLNTNNEIIWEDTPTAKNTITVSSANYEKAGLMSASDKVKLDTTIPGSIETEKQERIAADNVLQTNINIETSARILTDQELENKKINLLGNEAVSGEPYHFTYYYDINKDAEKITANAYTITLDNNKTLGSYHLDIPAADNSFAGLMKASDAKAVREDIPASILAESSARIEADNSLQTNINSEKIRAEGIEANLSTAISNENIRALAAEATLQTNINSEVSARITADASLENKKLDKTGGDTDSFNLNIGESIAHNSHFSLSEDMAAIGLATGSSLSTASTIQLTTDEILLAIANYNDETGISASSSQVKVYATDGDTKTNAILVGNNDATLATMGSSNNSITTKSYVDNKITDEANARIAADNAIMTDLSAEISTRASEDIAIRASVASEKSRAETAEAEIKADLSAEISNRINADTSITANLSTEITNRTNADTNLQEQINNLKAKGRFLSVWNSITGLPETNPTVSPYVYQAGDYFIVGKVNEAGTNYRPSGEQFVIGTASTVAETNTIKANDFYVYDGTTKNWILISATVRTYTFSEIAGNATDNTNLKNELDKKWSIADLNIENGGYPLSLETKGVNYTKLVQELVEATGLTEEAIKEILRSIGITTDINNINAGLGASVFGVGNTNYAAVSLTSGAFNTIGSSTDINAGVGTSVFGVSNNVQGQNSLAVGGSNSITRANSSFIVGNANSIDSRDEAVTLTNTIALGNHLVNNYSYSTAVGRYNLKYQDGKDILFQVGNGTAEAARSNAFEVLEIRNAETVQEKVAIKIGNTILTEEKLQKLIALLDTMEAE